MNASTPVIDTRRAMCEVDGLPEDQGEARVGGTDDGNANDGGASFVKEDKKSSTALEDRPSLLKGWKLESEAEYARRIGRDVREVKEEMLRDFEEYLALPIVFRPPSPVNEPRETQETAAKVEERGVEQSRSDEGVEVDDDQDSASDDESLENDSYEVISPEKGERDDSRTDRRRRVQNPRAFRDNKQEISPLATPDFGYLADGNVSREWAGPSDPDQTRRFRA